MSPDLTKAGIIPIKANTTSSCSLGTSNITDFLIYNLFINFEMHLSMKLLEHPLDKKYFLKVFNFKVKL